MKLAECKAPIKRGSSSPKVTGVFSFARFGIAHLLISYHSIPAYLYHYARVIWNMLTFMVTF